VCLTRWATIRGFFLHGVSRHLYAQSRPVALTPETLAHLGENDPKRPAKLQEQIALVVKAVVSPVVIYRNLRYKSTIGPWSQSHAVPDASGKDWIAVVYTLANFDLPEAMHYHRVITVMLAKHQYLFEPVDGATQLKQDYVYVHAPVAVTRRLRACGAGSAA